MNETSLIPAEPQGGSLRHGYNPYPPAGNPPPAGPPSPLKVIHLFLRGRYLLLLALIGVLSPLGAYVGYKSGHTLYRSSGLVRINPSQPKVLYSTENNSPIPMFEEYLDTEAHLMSSQRVMDQALQDADWKQMHAELPSDFAQTLADELEVTHQGEMIDVAVWDGDPQAALLGVRTVIRAYQHVFEEQNTAQEHSRDDMLLARRDQEMDDVNQIKQQILALANQYGTDDLSRAYEALFEQKTTLDQKLTNIRAGVQYGEFNQSGSVGPVGSEEAMIAQTDDHMKDLIKQRQGASMQIQQDVEVSQLGENNPRMKADRQVLRVINEAIEDEKKQYEAATGVGKNGAATRPAVASTTGGPSLPAGVVTEYAILKSEVDKCNEALLVLGRDKLKLEELKENKQEKENDLLQTNKRIDELNTESPLSGRLEIISPGEQSLRATDRKDTHMALAALGGGSGLAIALTVITLLGLRDRRLHGPEDTQYSTSNVPMLGMLPTLPTDLADGEQAAMAAHFVHGIRAMLQIKAGGEKGRVYAITSPSPHNGKTSVSLALGVSFAGAHSKTLLIDCDFVGRALTSRVNAIARPRLGHVLQQEGVIDDSDLQAALEQAERHGKRLGDVLVEMGCVSGEKLASALAAQKNTSTGVLEAIQSNTFKDCVAPTEIPGLSILPLGQANAEHVGSLSPALLRHALEVARQEYDVVIVDTGPILGSLEAAMIATLADDVVVVLSAGENRAAAERSMRYLESVGAKVAGFVFNRATPRDFVNSDGAKRVSSSADRWKHARSWAQSQKLSNFGPIAQAVARSVAEMNSKSTKGANGNEKVA